jgi:hypothetical protein
MQDPGNREENPFPCGDEVEEIPLDFHRIDLPGEVEAAGEAGHVGVDDDPGCDPIAGAEHNVGGLATNTRQGGHLVNRSWYLAAVFGKQDPAACLNRASLGTEESGRADRRHEIRGVGAGEGGRIRVAPKQTGSHLIDPGIGALGGQNCRDQELERVAMIELDLGFGPAGSEGTQDRRCAGPSRLDRLVPHPRQRILPDSPRRPFKRSVRVAITVVSMNRIVAEPK